MLRTRNDARSHRRRLRASSYVIGDYGVWNHLIIFRLDDEHVGLASPDENRALDASSVFRGARHRRLGPFSR